MCKIILKFGDKLTWDEIADHRETVENGAGIVGLYGSKIHLYKDMYHSKAFSAYQAQKASSPFTLFHSRMPSAGNVVNMNIQPFGDSRIVFCHNGTVSREKLYLTCASLKESFTRKDSDSLLLYKILKNIPIESALTLLTYSDMFENQNFVLISTERRRVYIIGCFEFEGVQKEQKVTIARNDWTCKRQLVETSFYGKVMKQEFLTRWQSTYSSGYCFSSSKSGQTEQLELDHTPHTLEDTGA